MRFTRTLSYRVKRFAAWVKQVILLGRIDWHKASDDANPPRLSRTEREQLRPAFDLHQIKPRTFNAVERVPVEESIPAAPPAPQEPPSETGFPPAQKRRRRRSNHTAVNPLSAFSPERIPASKLARLMEKFFGWRD